jgi:membrane-associated protease RseP (regulator of RpoE activity)
MPSPIKFVTVLGLVIAQANAIEPPKEAIAGLESQQFREREMAQAELLEWAREQPGPAMEVMLSQWKAADDPEARERCMNVLRDLVIDEYLKEGEGYIGIGLKDEIVEDPDERGSRAGIRVTQVQPNSPAERAGIRLNDLVVGINGEVWHDALFRANVRMMKPNMKVDLKILRDGELVNLKVTLGRRPLSADTPFFPGQSIDPESIERAAKEAYFRRWLSQRKLQK